MHPEEDMSTFLNGKLGLVEGTNMFIGIQQGPDEHVPVDAAFIMSSGGAPAMRQMGLRNEIRRVGLTIFYRSRSYLTASHNIQDIQNLLQDTTLPGYLDTVVVESAPSYLGKDENYYHMFSIPLELVFNSVRP